MNYIEISIEAEEQQQDLLISFLSDLNPSGFEQQPGRLLAFFPQEGYEPQAVQEVLEGYSYSVKEVKEQNWNEVWERSFEPVVVDDFCAIRADFHQPIAGLRHEIVITPKMSFGTGHHATTFMMIRQMEAIDFTNKTVFDFGTGTGILAILAEQLGAASILAIDIDEWSIINAKENVERNGCSRIRLEQADVLPLHQFDVILANINKNVILEHLPGLRSALTQKGVLLLSGLLVTDEEDMVNACNVLDLRLERKLEKDNWISLRFSKGATVI